MLLALQQHLAGRDGEELHHPVPGRVGDPSPTTGDVHLYPDPATQWTSVPLLFADCEGLDGGDKTPTTLASVQGQSGSSMGIFRPRARRAIPWAAANTMQRKREVIVRDLFPRVLYTLSDAVVFVLKEAR